MALNELEGVSTTEGEHWEQQRNFFHDHLAELVDGKGAQGFHDVIMDEVQDMKRSLAAKVNKISAFLALIGNEMLSSCQFYFAIAFWLFPCFVQKNFSSSYQIKLIKAARK